jgi:RimJ/RimL family protein N-acetyltransferase
MSNTDFETDRLELRPRTMADYEACLAMDRDPEVVQFVSGPWTDPAEHESFLKHRMLADFGAGFGYWSIYSRHCRPEFLGWVLLIPFDAIGPEIEIGWRLNRAAWGRGFASEAARPIICHAFNELRLHSVVADIHPQNVASIRVAEKVGMTFRGEGQHAGAPCKRYEMTQLEFLAAGNAD